MEPWSTEAMVSVLSPPPPEPAPVPLEQAVSSVMAVGAARTLRDLMVSPTVEMNQAEAVKAERPWRFIL
jgi:hypothetical protein